MPAEEKLRQKDMQQHLRIKKDVSRIIKLPAGI